MVLTAHSTAPQIVKQEHATQWRGTARVSQATVKLTLCVELVSNRVYIIIYYNTETQHNSLHSKIKKKNILTIHDLENSTQWNP